MNWLKNPYVITLLVVITLFIVVIVGSAIAAFVLSGRYKRWKTRTITPATSTKSSGWFWKLVNWIVVIGTVGFATFGIIKHYVAGTTSVKKITEFQLPINQHSGFDDKKMLLVTPTNMFLVDERGTNECRSVPIPFGKGCMMELGGVVWPYENGKPLKDEMGISVRLKPGDRGNWSNSCKKLGFKSAETNNVVVVLHFYNAR